jgi:hypothetical protein
MTISNKTRCSCLAASTNRKCRLPSSFIIQNKKFCFIHAHMLFDKSAAIIQKCFVGWKLRQKINNIFLKLPDELQRKIIWHIREPYYLKKYHYKPIQEILNARYLKISKDPYWIQPLPVDHAITYYNRIIDIYRLYIKYISITLTDYDLILYKIIPRVIRSIELDIHNNIFYQKDTQWVSNLQKTLSDLTNEFYIKCDIKYGKKCYK